MSKVAVVRTSPESVLADVGRVMGLADFQRHLPAQSETLLKLNISWNKFFPACSSTPWQIDGVIRALAAAGYAKESLTAVHNRTVVVDAYEGERNNKHDAAVARHGIRTAHLYEPQFEWVRFESRQPLLVLDRIFPEGVVIPKTLIGKNIVHLPTMKTHVFTTMTGAMKNAFGGLLMERRHWTHGVIHETLVDLLTIQRQIHPGLFAVMDGTVAGDGPGPRAMRFFIGNLLLASADQVAIDAIAAKIMGFDPLSLRFIRLAHEQGLGCGDPNKIEVVGEDIGELNWHFQKHADTFASRGQKAIYHGPLKPLENLLLRTPIVPWSYLASNVYHNLYWYNLFGRSRVRDFMGTEWGKLFQSY